MKRTLALCLAALAFAVGPLRAQEPTTTPTAAPTVQPTTVAPSPTDTKESERTLRTCADNIDSIWSTIQRYRNYNHGAYPPNLAALIPKYQPKPWICPACHQDTYSVTFHGSGQKQSGIVVCCRGENHPTAQADYPRLDYRLGLLTKPDTSYQKPDGSAYPIPYVDDLLDEALSLSAKASPTWGSKKVQPLAESYRQKARGLLKEAAKSKLSIEQKAFYDSIERDIGK